MKETATAKTNIKGEGLLDIHNVKACVCGQPQSPQSIYLTVERD